MEAKGGGAVGAPVTLSTDLFIDLFGTRSSASGISITPETAMTCTPLRAAVTTISEAVGQLPVHVFQRAPDGSKSRALDHPASGLLQGEANPWTPAQDFREQLTLDALLHGNGFAFINRASNGEPVELIRLAPPAVEVRFDPNSGEPVYVYKPNGGREESYVFSDVLHVKAPSVHGVIGDSPVYQAREAIALALVMEAHAAKLFGNGARPSGVLSFPGKLTAEVAARIKASWQAAHGGASSGGTAVLEEDAKFVPLTFTSTDSQFLELRRFAVEEIARIYRVPHHMIGEMGRATFSNAETMNRQFLQLCLLPWIERWTGQARKLFAPEERDTLFAEFVVDDLLRADLAARAPAYSTLISARVLNPNEVRALENRPPYAGGDTFENPHTTTGAAA